MVPTGLQIDQLKQELSKKESELLALQTKLETLNNQNSDCKQHIEVLKESLTAKEQRAAILQTEVTEEKIHTYILYTEINPIMYKKGSSTFSVGDPIEYVRLLPRDPDSSECNITH